MNIVDRIIQFADYKEITISKFSKIIQVSNSYFTKQKKNNANVGSNIIEKIVSEYPELNLEWLLTGNGKMLKSEKPKIESKIKNSLVGNSVVGEGNHMNLQESGVDYGRENVKMLKQEIEYLKEQNQLLKDMIELMKTK